MAKPRKKLTPAQRAEKKRRRLEFMTVFIRGKQVRVRRPPTIDGVDVEDFILQNTDPIWLHQNGYYELLEEQAMADQEDLSETHTPGTRKSKVTDESDDIPF